MPTLNTAYQRRWRKAHVIEEARPVIERIELIAFDEERLVILQHTAHLVTRIVAHVETIEEERVDAPLHGRAR